MCGFDLMNFNFLNIETWYMAVTMSVEGEVVQCGVVCELQGSTCHVRAQYNVLIW